MNDCHVSIQSSGKENESADIFIMYIHVVAIALGAKSSYFSQTAENSHLLYTASAENELHDPVAYSIPVGHHRSQDFSFPDQAALCACT